MSERRIADMRQKRVMLVVNKWWEADPLSWVLFHDKARPRQFADFTVVNYPTQRPPREQGGVPPGDPPSVPRFTFQCADARVEVWCVEELMNPAESSSSTAEKARVLPGAFASGEPPSLVVAIGTAGSREGLMANGCVVVGRRVFIHDPFATAPDRAGKWTPPHADAVVDSELPGSVFRKLSPESRHSAEARLIAPPVAPAHPLLILAGNGFISLGIVNVTNYDDYVWADRAAIEAFEEKASIEGQIGSIETTHGLIRSMSDAPFLYVSGISDTEGLFDAQVTPRVYAQNTVAAHNAAVATAWLLPDLVRAL
jgi:hypothetical protein